ncbi:MAG: thioredoxin family protein [Acidimicrobiia bacterium]|nr:thioredoxin family protein [Acidimicrobiia bacterium]
METMDVTLLHIDDCPNWRTTETHLVRLRPEYGFELQRKRVGSAEEAEQLRFRGSPTVLINGLDPFADPNAPVGMSCRLYRTIGGLVGSPTEEMLREVLAAAGTYR